MTAKPGVGEEIFDQWTIDAWRRELTVERAVRAAQIIANVAALRSGATIIDLGCGVGMIAQALAARGFSIVGIDRSSAAIAIAQLSATASCSFIEGDWRSYKVQEKFDCALFWGTTLCAGDEADFEALRKVAQHLHPGGCVLVETRHWDRMERRFDAQSRRSTPEFDLIETHEYDPRSGYQTTAQAFAFADQTIQRQYRTRRYTYQELRNMCLRAGYFSVDGLDENGGSLANDSERVILRARIEGPAA